MLVLKPGRIALKLSSDEIAVCKRYFESCHHKEPKDLSWQWSVKKTPELMSCKNLCVSKICPKPSFFPRFKKVFVPANKKACQAAEAPISWKEYFSFLFPDPVPIPPLIKCRKLQAIRRKCCGNPMNCKENCLTVDCCPKPKEWYGQIEIFVIPSSLPSEVTYQEPLPCPPLAPSETSCISTEKKISTLQKKPFNIEDYAYKMAFSGINFCDEIRLLSTHFKCKRSYASNLHDAGKNLRLSCGFFSEFKEVECPKIVYSKNTAFKLPSLICKEHRLCKDTLHKTEIDIEVKKGICGRTTFLKPFKDGDKLAGTNHSRHFHTAAYNTTQQSCDRRKLFHTTSVTKKSKQRENGELHTEKITDDMKPVEIGMPYHYESNNQPAKSGVGLHSILLKPLSGRLKEGLYTPPDPYPLFASTINNASQEIDPQLIKLAEETKKRITYGIQTTHEEKPNNTLAKQLSRETEEKRIKKVKEKGEEIPINYQNAHQKSKLSLLNKKKNPIVVQVVTFMTEANHGVKQAKKRNNKNSKRKDIICEGCSGIKEAERQEANPTPKNFLDCKVRAAGKCPGPQRKLHPDEGEPNNPYYRNKKKPYSLCNKPRQVIKKKEHSYSMPCEDTYSKRKFHSFCLITKSETPINTGKDEKEFHSSSAFCDTNTNIPTLYDVLKVRGLGKFNKQLPIHSNEWDSHTSDSYREMAFEECNSVPDLSKYQTKGDGNIEKMSYPVNLWGCPDNKKENPNQWSNHKDKNSLGEIGIQTKSLSSAMGKRHQIPSDSRDSNNSVPSKYNVLFNPILVKKKIVKNENNFNHKSITQNFKVNDTIKISKTVGCNDTKPECRSSNVFKPHELSVYSVISQKSSGDQQSISTSQNSSPLVNRTQQDLKGLDKKESNNYNFIKDHTGYISKPKELNKYFPKTNNENELIFYKEKVLMLSDSAADSENDTAINESKTGFSN